MRSYRLLIVDDDAVDRRLYGKLLAQRGLDTCHTEQAATGTAGLAALRAYKFDCVLLDFNLPDMTGFEFMTAAAIDGEPPCAVVLITGQGNEAIAVEAMKRGVRDYLAKERVNASSLWRTVTQAVTQTELHQRLASSLRDLTAANLALEKEAATRKAADSELRAAKAAAEQASHAKTRFVAMVTHELRTPLNGILGYAQLLRIQAGLSARQDAHVEAMMQAGRHLLEMIERVLDFASIETGQLELHPQEVSVVDLTEGCIAFISRMATERALSLRVVHAHDAPRQIVADPMRLRQVLTNLLGNAVKYTDAGGVELRVLAGASPGSLRLEVADTGPGIDEAKCARLFQDFGPLQATTSMEGSGLGLAIAARIVRLMGSKLNHVPNSGHRDANIGSVFSFELGAGVTAPSMPGPVKREISVSCRRILLVDDIAMNRDVIGAFLSAAGHTVIQAESGQMSIQLAAEQTFDLILMDVRMPEMDGLEAARRIRMLPGAHGRLPILALTAYTFPDQIAQCSDAGMDGHVAKPVDYATLVSAIDDAIARKPPPRSVDRPAPQGAPARAVDNVDTDISAQAQLPARFDRAVFERTLSFLSPEDAIANLRSLRARKEEMLRLLDQRAEPPLVTDLSHALASAAGVFGFLAISGVARNFERAMMQDASQAEGLAQQLYVETGAGLVLLDALLCEKRVHPA